MTLNEINILYISSILFKSKQLETSGTIFPFTNDEKYIINRVLRFIIDCFLFC